MSKKKKYQKIILHINSQITGKFLRVLSSFFLQSTAKGKQSTFVQNENFLAFLAPSNLSPTKNMQATRASSSFTKPKGELVGIFETLEARVSWLNSCLDFIQEWPAEEKHLDIQLLATWRYYFYLHALVTQHRAVAEQYQASDGQLENFPAVEMLHVVTMRYPRTDRDTIRSQFCQELQDLTAMADDPLLIGWIIYELDPAYLVGVPKAPDKTLGLDYSFLVCRLCIMIYILCILNMISCL